MTLRFYRRTIPGCHSQIPINNVLKSHKRSEWGKPSRGPSVLWRELRYAIYRSLFARPPSIGVVPGNDHGQENFFRVCRLLSPFPKKEYLLYFGFYVHSCSWIVHVRTRGLTIRLIVRFIRWSKLPKNDERQLAVIPVLVWLLTTERKKSNSNATIRTNRNTVLSFSFSNLSYLTPLWHTM